jgi:hypothetical protein
MDDKTFNEIYGISDQEKVDMIERASNDVSFLDEEELFETDEYYETLSDYETEEA